MNIIARDFGRLVEVMARLTRDIDQLGRGVLTMNEVLVGRDPQDAVRVARRHLNAAPLDFKAARAEIASLDFTELKTTSFASFAEELESSVNRYPDLAEAIQDHLVRQIRAGERKDRARLAELAVSAKDFNVPAAEMGVVLNKAFLTLINKDDVQYGVNTSFLIVAQTNLDLMEAFGEGRAGFEQAAEIANAAAEAIRAAIQSSKTRLAVKLRARNLTDINTRHVNGKPLREFLDEIEASYQKVHRTELAFADAFEDMASAIEDIHAERDIEGARRRLNDFDQRSAELMRQRLANAEEAVEFLAVFRDLKL